jgi:hypothetical protein
MVDPQSFECAVAVASGAARRDALGNDRASSNSFGL